MRASQEFSVRDEWMSTAHARLDQLRAVPPRKKAGMSWLTVGIVILLIVVAAKYVGYYAKTKGWL
jgi:cytochrome c-type biogenesis protein CcmH/NrfG